MEKNLIPIIYIKNGQHLGNNTDLIAASMKCAHTFVSVTKADISEELLKPYIGHAKDMDTFGIYGHTVNGEMDRAAAAIDEVFDKLLK